MERIVAAVDEGDLDVLYSSQVAFAPSSRVVRVGLLLPELDLPSFSAPRPRL
jgi:hypothetical protein